MRLDTYQSLTHITAVYPAEHSIPYLALGLTGEAGELSELMCLAQYTSSKREAVALEMGDVIWYLSELASKLGLQLSDLAVTSTLSLSNYDKRHLALGVVASCGKVANKVKKILRDKLTIEQVVTDLSEYISDVLAYMSALAAQFGLTLGELAVMNIDKLTARKRNNTLKGSDTTHGRQQTIEPTTGGERDSTTQAQEQRECQQFCNKEVPCDSTQCGRKPD